MDARRLLGGVTRLGTRATVFSSLRVSKTSLNCRSVLGVVGSSESEGDDDPFVRTEEESEPCGGILSDTSRSGMAEGSSGIGLSGWEVAVVGMGWCANSVEDILGGRVAIEAESLKQRPRKNSLLSEL